MSTPVATHTLRADTDLSDERPDSFHHKEKELISDSDTDASSLSTGAAIDIRNEDLNLITDITDSHDMPANTLRMWTMLAVFGTLLAGVDAMFTMRYPSIGIGEVVAVVIAWPFGRLWHLYLPNYHIPVGFGKKIELNPGPFSHKEMACILMFVNVCTKIGLTDGLMIEQIHFFGVNIGFGPFCYFNFVTYLVGWGWAGLARSILVQPANMTWPGVLGQVALAHTLGGGQRSEHEKQLSQTSWKISRLGMFGAVFGFSFVWYWISGFIFPALADIGAFISWAAPKSATVSQVFGVQTGMGLFPLSLDWNMISNLSNPLLTPFWAAACLFGSFVLWGWIITPALYYTNTWQTGYFPIMTNKLFSAKGKPYDFSKVITKDWRLDHAAYAKYSPVMLPIAFVLNAGLGLATFFALIVHAALHWRDDIYIPFRERKNHTDIHNVLMRKYKGVSKYFFIASTIVGLVLGIVYCHVYRGSIQIGAGGFVVSIIICAIFYLPAALIEARTGFVIDLGNFLELISSFWLKEQPIACLYFATFGYACMQHAMHQAQSSKMGHYLKVPTRLTAIVLFVAGIWSSLVNTAVVFWVLHHTDNVCTAKAGNNFTCRKAQVSFNSHVAWGLFGSKLFAKGGRYVDIYYFVIPAIVFVLFIFAMARRYPGSFWKYVNPILLVTAGTKLPANTGVNFSAWFVVVFIFGFLLHKKRTAWWRKYNMIVAVGLDTGVAIAVIIIYFSLTYTGAAKHFHWWGTEVSKKGCDAIGCPHLDIKDLVRPTGW